MAKSKYKNIDISNRAELDAIKVGDTFIYNQANFYPMIVTAVTKDLIVGRTDPNLWYTIITKHTLQVGPDSFWCLGYDPRGEAQKNLNDIQSWWDHYRETGKETGTTFGQVYKDPRGRNTIKLTALKIKQ